MVEINVKGDWVRIDLVVEHPSGWLSDVLGVPSAYPGHKLFCVVQLEIVVSASCYDQSIVAWCWVKRNKGRYIDSGFMRCTQQC